MDEYVFVKLTTGHSAKLKVMTHTDTSKDTIYVAGRPQILNNRRFYEAVDCSQSWAQYDEEEGLFVMLISRKYIIPVTPETELLYG